MDHHQQHFASNEGGDQQQPDSSLYSHLISEQQNQ